MEWTGNLTLKMDEEEGHYSHGLIEVEKYGSEPCVLALKITSSDGRAKTTIRFSYEEYKKFVKELAQKL